MKILITIGATREPIDSVRYITNFSTGETGALLAEQLSSNSHEVSALCGVGSVFPRNISKKILFSSFNDLNEKIETELANNFYDIVIHAAAVSDYSPLHSSDRKLDSAKELIVKFKRNFKILDRIKSYSKNVNIKIVAFKLTDTSSFDEQKVAIEKCFKSPGVVVVVQNDYSGVRSAQRTYNIITFKNETIACNSRQELSEKLVKTLNLQNKSSEIEL